MNGKFGENCSPQYHIVEIQESILQEERGYRRKKTWKTITGSSVFHVAVFTPHAAHFKASPRLCMCPQCMMLYGSCNLFEAYKIEVVTSKTPALRNDMPPPPEIVGQEKVSDFVHVGTYVAVAAPKSSDTMWVVDPFWIIKVIKIDRVDMVDESIDSFGFRIAPKVIHLEGNFLEKEERLTTSKKKGYYLSKKTTYLFKESIFRSDSILDCKRR